MISIPKSVKKVVIGILPILLLSSHSNLVKAEASEVEVSFIAEDGGMLTDSDGKTQKTIVKKVKDGTSVEDILPTTVPDKNYKFNMWEYPEDNKESGKITSVVREYKATFFPDFNNNGKDDRTEEITVKFDTDTNTKIDDKKIKVGDTIEFPKLLKENSIFLGWYSDSDFKNPVIESDKILDSTTFYAKWSSSSDLINSNSTVTIRDKEISDQLEQKLVEEQRKLDLELDEKLLKENEEIKKAKEQSTMTVVKFEMDNRNMGRNYLMKFYDTKENFLFSLVVPYGKTIRTMNESKSKIEEYSVRQTTTIVLNENEFVNSGSKVEKYLVRNVQENSTEIAEIYPLVQNNVNDNSTSSTQNTIDSSVNSTKDKKSLLNSDTSFYLIGGGIVILLVGILYIYKFKIKGRFSEDTEKSDIE